MNYHIVRTDEKISDIAQIYNLSVNEIESINAHIRSWDKLIPGTKLRLPAIPEQVRLEVDDTEPFIEDYYPKISVDQLKVNNFKINESPNQQVNFNPVPNAPVDMTPNTTPTNIVPNDNQESNVTPGAMPVTSGNEGAQTTGTTSKPASKPAVPPKPMYPYYPYYNPYYPYYGYPNYQYYNYNYGTRKR
jgi:LysM repeat protein